MLETPNYIEIISEELWFKNYQVQVVLDLVWEWSTVPFIARYRKERTWNLDEAQIRDIIDLQKKLENLFNAKNTAINGITEVGMMTEELMVNIINAKTLKEVEEIYKPYKSKKKTKAMIAIEKGFQVLADFLKTNPSLSTPFQGLPLGKEENKGRLIEFFSLFQREYPQGEGLIKQFPLEEIIEWSLEIIWAEISANGELRHLLIEELQKYGMISSNKKSDKMLEKLNEKDKEQIKKFEIYFDFSTKLAYVKPYQTLALNRWEKLWILTVKIEKDEIIFDKLKNKYSRLLELREEFIEELETAFKIWYDALFSSVENEIRSELSEIWEDDSIKTFQTNLSALLMTKPEYGKTILAIDPGYRAWCKMAILDTLWNPIKLDKIFLHELLNARTKLQDIFSKNKIDIVVIWNWTASDETTALVGELFSGDIFIVNESWASVYSASEVAGEEFPDLDSLDRGTISIGRRYIDPLSELVKVPVGSIGVGMYQHDMPEKKLEEKLGYVVEDSVNQVGINVNTASIYLLSHISWIDKRQAKKIYNNRPYKSRKELQKVLWEKAYEQAIWFLRVPESSETLDNTDIHPEQYDLAKYLIENNIKKVDTKSKELYPDVNQDTIDFILEAYKNIWKEKRTVSTHTKAKKSVTFESLKVWDVLDGVVRNVVAFWAFVDVWQKNDGLVHISQLADSFVKNPMDIVQVWDKVKVRITDIDTEKNKLQLSMRWV